MVIYIIQQKKILSSNTLDFKLQVFEHIDFL